MNAESIAERIARKIEAQAEFEGVRAQRILKMCARIAREEGRRAESASPSETVTATQRMVLDAGAEAGKAIAVEASRSRNLLRIEDVAELTGVSANTLRFWRSKGTGPLSAKLGRRVVYRESDVRDWLDKRFGEGVGDE